MINTNEVNTLEQAAKLEELGLGNNCQMAWVNLDDKIFIVSQIEYLCSSTNLSYNLIGPALTCSEIGLILKTEWSENKITTKDVSKMLFRGLVRECIAQEMCKGLIKLKEGS